MALKKAKPNYRMAIHKPNNPFKINKVVLPTSDNFLKREVLFILNIKIVEKENKEYFWMYL